SCGATSFIGDAQFPGGPDACRSRCSQDGLKEAAYVYAGEYSSACVCAPVESSKLDGPLQSSSDSPAAIERDIALAEDAEASPPEASAPAPEEETPAAPAEVGPQFGPRGRMTGRG